MPAMVLRVLVEYLRRHRTRYLSGIALLLATNACALAIPWIIKDAIEAVSGSGPRGSTGPASYADVVRLALLVIGLAVLQALTRSASRLTLLGASQRVEARIRDHVFAHLLRL